METKVRTIQLPSQIYRNIALLGAFGLGVGAFLPWGTVEGMSISGAEGSNGIIILAIAIISLIMLFTKKIPLWIVSILGLATVTLGIFYIVDMYQAFNAIDLAINVINGSESSIFTEKSFNFNKDIGIGLYLIIVSAGLITVGSFIQFLKNKK